MIYRFSYDQLSTKSSMNFRGLKEWRSVFLSGINGSWKEISVAYRKSEKLEGNQECLQEIRKAERESEKLPGIQERLKEFKKELGNS